MAEVTFGVSFGSCPLGMPSASEILDLAPRAEELGYDSFWVGDHISMYSPILESLTLLSAFGARTRRMKLGTAVLLLPLRHPTVVAKMVSTLDFLTSGRIILGVGVGGENPKEWAACGVPLTERGRRADEGIEILRRLWTESKVTYQGRFYQLEDLPMEPKPAQLSGPPIWVGGRSGAALRRAARLGDGWISYAVTPQRFQESREKIAAYAQEQGRDLASFSWAHLFFICAAERREEARRTAVRYLTATYNQPWEPRVDRYCAVGTPQDCIAFMEGFVAAGARNFVLRPTCPPGDIARQMEIYAQEIVPHFRGEG